MTTAPTGGSNIGAPERTVNIPLLRKAVEWAEAEAALGEKGAWDQSIFINERPLSACGTSYCIAGWALHEAGWSDSRIKAAVKRDWQDDDEVSNAAADLLGIPRDTSGLRGGRGHLFVGDNTIADVRRIAEDLAGGRL